MTNCTLFTFSLSKPLVVFTKIHLFYRTEVFVRSLCFQPWYDTQGYQTTKAFNRYEYVCREETTSRISSRDNARPITSNPRPRSTNTTGSRIEETNTYADISCMVG